MIHGLSNVGIHTRQRTAEQDAVNLMETFQRCSCVTLQHCINFFK